MARRGSDEFENMTEEFPEHPLFPQDDPEDPAPDVKFITLYRFENGRQRSCSRMFRADELKSLATIDELYGGGAYELLGRSASKRDASEPGNITVRRKYDLPGPSRPLGNYTAEQPADAGQARALAQPTILGNENIVIAMMNMQAQAASAAAAQAQQQSQQFMAMMASMMQNSKSESAAMTQMMIQMSQASQQSMVQMITAMMANKSGGPEEMAKFLEIAKSMNGFGQAKLLEEGKEKEMDFGAMLENATDLVAGVSNIMSARAAALGQSAGQPAVSFEPRPPGNP